MRNEAKMILEQMLNPAFNPDAANDRAAVDMNELNKRVSRLVDFALIYAHAVDYMKAHAEVHPLIAFMHATECEEIAPQLVGGPLTDSELVKMVIAWRQLCHTPAQNPLAAELERQAIYNPFEVRE